LVVYAPWVVQLCRGDIILVVAQDYIYQKRRLVSLFSVYCFTIYGNFVLDGKMGVGVEEQNGVSSQRLAHSLARQSWHQYLSIFRYLWSK